MKLFKKSIEETKEYKKAIEEVEKVLEEAKPEPEEEWIWVEGYKGTDKNMCCRGYQYELVKQYNMPEDEKIIECESGFHLCFSLRDVMEYYPIGQGNRFFKVKALVRKSDKDEYGKKLYEDYRGYRYCVGHNNKLASKSIVFLSELSIDEILKDTDVQNLPEAYKKMAIDSSMETAIDEYHLNILLEDGYSKPFAYHIVKNTKSFDIAHAIGSQPDLSMDMKVLTILYNR